MTDTPTPIELTTEQVALIRESARRLRSEFDGTFNAETIERYITDTQDILSSTAKFTTWLPVLIERFTRERLRARERLETDTLTKPAVLFLCVQNAGRSQMAAGWLRHLAGDSVEVFSGGSDPKSGTDPVAIEAMAEVGIDISSEYPKPWTDEIARAADVIVSMGCGDACPILPGKRYADWDLPDPAGQSIDTVRAIRDDIGRRVTEMMASLELATA